MKRFITGAAALCCVILAGCTTVNNFEKYVFEGSRIAGTMRTPPEPTIAMDYNVNINREDPLSTAISVVSNLAKATQVPGARERMFTALDAVDLPRLIWDETYKKCLDRLSATPVRSLGNADYIFDLEILEYGLQAESFSGAVMVEVAVMARIYHTDSRELVWKRRISEEVAMNPELFGIQSDIGNIMTTYALSALSERQLAEGFILVGRQTAQTITRKLEKDMYDALFSD